MKSFWKMYAVFIRQIYLIKKNPTRLSGTFLWLIIDILQWGFISKYIGTFGGATFNLATALLGAIILWEFMTRVQQGLMTGFMEDIWSQNFVNIFASPIKMKEYIGGLIMNGTFSSLLGFLMIIVLAGLFFGYNIFVIGILIVPLMFILFLFGTAVGIFVASIMFRFGPAAEWLAWPIPFALSICSGVFYPISTLPAGLQAIAKIIPASYVFESLRSILAGKVVSGDIMMNFLFGFGLSLIYFFITYFFFIRVYRRNLENGYIARFNAEI